MYALAGLAGLLMLFLSPSFAAKVGETRWPTARAMRGADEATYEIEPIFSDNFSLK
jgi:hypothetical protein